MIRFSRVFDYVTEVERRKVGEVQGIFRKAFSAVAAYADKIPDLLGRVSDRGFETVLLTIEDERARVLGFALVHYYSDIRYAYLDYIATDPEVRKRGLGSALYEGLREYMVRKGARGLFMDVPPDEPARVADAERLPRNRQRLKFYERYGAYPIIGTQYDFPAPGSQSYDPPFLVFDSLGPPRPLPRADARKAVRAILSRKYGWNAEDPYVRSVIESFKEDPVPLRAPLYVKPEAAPPTTGRLRPIKLVAAEHHEIHHVREKGYVERPARVDAILRGLAKLDVEPRPVRHFGEQPIRAVHDGDFVSYLAAATASLPPDETLYPYVFPIRRPDRKPRDRAVRAGYYCIDTFTPLSQGAYRAARAAVDCAMSGAELILKGERLVYAVCRPPGHHAEKRVFGGFCYFNNAAIAAHRLGERGKVALLDIDFHHGNGSQDIFYRRDDVFTVSIHGHPNYSYPYFSGFADENGEGPGLGFNRNFPLPEGIDDKRYLEVLGLALREIEAFKPATLVVSLGYDIMRGDPTGAFILTPPGLTRIGEAIGRLGLPVLVVQEGGYLIRNLSRGAAGFFAGLARTWY